jgi:hypothetical protein
MHFCYVFMSFPCPHLTLSCLVISEKGIWYVKGQEQFEKKWCPYEEREMTKSMIKMILLSI